ncbi:MAG: hypothetical protein A2741_02300 [Candidatus Zambryskibacteria bacterium RIFCSPHIGHO2_01_FULL_43_27]|uniref:Uncharacterized protein n=1 Tax=Candidatus Zambryskibacteria bacterium RIFCSPLOWO2_01_FULL_43_17 TaxID=1802760 RepID=A0A1G2U6B6_9BACT|nr:MAG: hypothetical protein A2741_02300 [Candidatus Zambryskibacteria bacterium RIFCSPHIGHO2_01_FULL_43_27]OHB00508.1 MAG: hypothetical protein A3E93_01780 [Candidatus Zambryskibacteria bacterium RIFCSPHIGHO2_12_FULL_43_12b]OHB04540.1 MAG: hypothetical protein A2920_01170 [Candidatus Zambryskibacteria bacterium RIFCSPLOWO2_01_FULL_43_17]
MGRTLSDKRVRKELVKKAAEELRRKGVTIENRDTIFRKIFGSPMIDPTISAEIWIRLQNR